MMRRILLALVPLLLVCALLELVLRTTHLFNARLSWTQPDHEIGWRFTPGREYWFFGENDHAIEGRINSHGWRDGERSLNKAPGTRRIAVVGDSFVEAFQVELDSTFAAIAERALNGNDTGARYEVMNFGRSGMSPSEELIVLERDILPCAPDLVMLLFTPQNDIADVNPFTTSDPCRPFFRCVAGDSLLLDASFVNRRDFRAREMINPLKQRSALLSLVAERFNAWRQVRARERLDARGGIPPGTPALTHEQRMCTAHPDSVYAANYAVCKQLIARMARTCARHGVRFALASVPLVYMWDDMERAQSADATFEAGFFDRDLGAMADSSGFAFSPMTDAFAKEARSRAAPLHWQHWNYAGHRLAATQIVGALASPAAPAGAD